MQYLFKFIKATGFPLKDARLSNKLQSSIRSGILVNFEKRETLYCSWVQHENHICRILLLFFKKDIYVSIGRKKGILYLCLCIPINELFLTLIAWSTESSWMVCRSVGHNYKKKGREFTSTNLTYRDTCLEKGLHNVVVCERPRTMWGGWTEDNPLCGAWLMLFMSRIHFSF